MRHEKAENLLRLALFMQSSADGVGLQDIQQEFSVGRRTAERMRDAVLRAFPQAEEVTTGEKIKRWRMPASSLNGFLNLHAEDLIELENAISLLIKNNQKQAAETLKNIKLKLKSLIRPESARRVDTDLSALLEAEGYALRPGPRPKIENDVLLTLREAIKACHKVHFSYESRIKRDEKLRSVAPYGLLYGSRHYLVGYCDDAKDIRLFSLANIKNIALTKKHFTKKSGFDLRAYAEQSFGVFQEKPFDVEWRFSLEASRDARNFLFHPTQKINENPDGTVTVSFRAGGHQEMLWHLYTWGEHVEVIKPDKLRKAAIKS